MGVDQGDTDDLLGKVSDIVDARISDQNKALDDRFISFTNEMNCQFSSLALELSGLIKSSISAPGRPAVDCTPDGQGTTDNPRSDLQHGKGLGVIGEGQRATVLPSRSPVTP